MKLTDSEKQAAQIHFALMDVSECDIIAEDNPAIQHEKREYNERYWSWEGST